MKKLIRFIKRSIRVKVQKYSDGWVVKINKYNDGWAIKIRYRKR